MISDLTADCRSETRFRATFKYHTLLYMVFASWPRYSISLRPELHLLASWSLKILSEYLTERRKLAYEKQ